jgi:5-hydroxyisourate hydrolase
MAKLTTHILDTAHGRPAYDVAVRLFAIGDERLLRAETRTNEDGRTDSALLDSDAIQIGCYELEFDIGAYFRSQSVTLPKPAFLETVVIRFCVSADEHYHVPLLASPWSYSTYRGS